MAMTLSGPGVMLGAEQLEAHERWQERGLLALAGIGVEPGLADVFARYAADHLFDEIDEVGVRDGADLVVEGYDFAPTFSIWTTIEECLNPPLDLGEGARLLHHRAVLGARAVRVPGGDRRDRVRQRRARGGRARAARDRLPPRDLQVRARHRVHRRPPDAAQARARLDRAGAGARRRGRAARRRRGRPPRSRDARRPDARQDVRRHARHRARARTARTAPSTSTTSPTTSGRCASTAIRRSSSRPRSTRWSRSSCSPPAPGKGTGVLGPEAFPPDPFLELLADYGEPHGIVDGDPRRT